MLHYTYNVSTITPRPVTALCSSQHRQADSYLCTYGLSEMMHCNLRRRMLKDVIHFSGYVRNTSI